MLKFCPHMRLSCRIAMLSALLIGTAFGQTQRERVPTTAPSPVAPVEPTTVMLPAPADDTVLAGGGRYLLLPMQRLRQVIVLDIQAARIVRILRVDSDQFSVAGGATKAIVQLADKQQLQRWNLESGALEATAPLPADPGQMLMGCASEGPLLIGGAFVDVTTLKKRAMSIIHQVGDDERRREGGFGDFELSEAMVRPDGQVFASRLSIMVLSGDTAMVYIGIIFASNRPPREIQDMYPSGDVVDPEGHMTSDDRQRMFFRMPHFARTLPAVQRDWLVCLASSDGPRGRSTVGLAALYDPRLSRERKLLDLPPMPELESRSAIDQFDPFPLRKRCFVDVDNGWIVTLPPSAERVLIRRVDTSVIKNSGRTR